LKKRTIHQKYKTILNDAGKQQEKDRKNGKFLRNFLRDKQFFLIFYSVLAGVFEQ
jgi:hypothetical protein